jgi:D-glycerate 3-kinase
MSLEERLLRWCQLQIRSGQRPLIGLNGPVGAGKSTLARRLQELFAAAELELAVASIDDAYLPWPQRTAAMAGNPYGVNRVPPGSHEPDALHRGVRRWRAAPDRMLELPRFDKTLRDGQGDRVEPWRGTADVLLLEGWMLGCRPVMDLECAATALRGRFNADELEWWRRCDQALEAYLPLWQELDQLVMLWPTSWRWPRRWRLQAEAMQRRRGGGWMPAAQLDRLVTATLQSLPPDLYQQPVLAMANSVRVLDQRRRSVWEGSGEAALSRWAQPCSVSSSATGYTKP